MSSLSSLFKEVVLVDFSRRHLDTITIILALAEWWCSPWRQGLDRAAAPLSSRSSSPGFKSACWVGNSSPTKPPDVPGRGSPRASITWLLTSDILLRTSAIWALRRIRTPESGAERRTAWGRRSRSFLEWWWAEGDEKQKKHGSLSKPADSRMRARVFTFIIYLASKVSVTQVNNHFATIIWNAFLL